jgi:MFS family permease
VELPHKCVSAAWWAVFTIFLIHGLVVSTWVSRIPAIQTSLRLSNGVLGLTLLSSAAGAVCSIPATGWLVSHYGSKPITILTSASFCLFLNLPGIAWNRGSLAAGLFLFGAAAAAMDVSMNAQGVEVEKALGHPTMSRFHALFSLGGMLGAGVGGVVANAHVGPRTHFAVASIILLFATLAISPLFLHTAPLLRGAAHRLPIRQIPPILLALSAIAFFILLTEGAMADWTALYLRQVLDASAGLAAAGYAVFSAAMALFRLMGDTITLRLGPARTVRAGSMTAGLGLIWAIAMPTPAWALPGFFFAGAGLSVIIPLVFGSGGRVGSVSPGAGIATVTGLGYLGFIAGPPTIGFVSQMVTLRYALLVVVVCCFTSAVLAGFMRGLESAPKVEPVMPSQL